VVETTIEGGGQFLTRREREALAKLSNLARGMIFGPYGRGVLLPSWGAACCAPAVGSVRFVWRARTGGERVAAHASDRTAPSRACSAGVLLSALGLRDGDREAVACGERAEDAACVVGCFE